MDVCVNGIRQIRIGRKLKNKRRRRRPEEALLFLMSLTTTRETAFSTGVRGKTRMSHELANEPERCPIYARSSREKFLFEKSNF